MVNFISDEKKKEYLTIKASPLVDDDCNINYEEMALLSRHSNSFSSNGETVRIPKHETTVSIDTTKC